MCFSLFGSDPSYVCSIFVVVFQITGQSAQNVVVLFHEGQGLVEGGPVVSKHSEVR